MRCGEMREVGRGCVLLGEGIREAAMEEGV